MTSSICREHSRATSAKIGVNRVTSELLSLLHIDAKGYSQELVRSLFYIYSLPSLRSFFFKVEDVEGRFLTGKGAKVDEVNEKSPLASFRDLKRAAPRRPVPRRLTPCLPRVCYGQTLTRAVFRFFHIF